MSDMLCKWYKENDSDQIWWKDNRDVEGEYVISFDRKTELNLFRDYPYAFTAEQKEIFDRENPFWADFFRERTE